MALLAKLEHQAFVNKPRNNRKAEKRERILLREQRDQDWQASKLGQDSYYVHQVFHGTSAGNQAHPRGPPGASRGIAGGGVALWGFERCPSLLPPVMERDRGRIGRSVAGLPPSALMEPPSSLGTNRTEEETARSTARSTARTPVMARVQSDPGLRPRFTGLQGVIGMQWDNASTPAGTAYRGGDGQIGLGF
jgi:hypothetical protein